jgi:hypothetical protein
MPGACDLKRCSLRIRALEPAVRRSCRASLLRMHLGLFGLLLAPLSLSLVLATGCTPSKEKVEAAAGPFLTSTLGEAFDIVAVKSEFNEGNGDPGRVRIWATSATDPELRLSFSTSYDGGRLTMDPARLVALAAKERTSLDLSRAFVVAGTPHLPSFAVRVRVNSNGVQEIVLRLFEAVCESGPDCTVWPRLGKSLATYGKGRNESQELTVYFFEPGRDDRPRGGQLMERQPLPGTRAPWRSSGSLYVIHQQPLVLPVDMAALEASVGLNRSSVSHSTHWTRLRAALKDTLDARHGQAMHLDPGGGPLRLVPGSLNRAQCRAVTCPKNSLGKRLRCPDEVQVQVNCLYDLQTGNVQLLPVTDPPPR